MPQLDLLVPGDPATATGGYVYDRRILDALSARGWRTRVHALDPSFPRPTPAALAHARDVLAALPDGRTVVLDGLALGIGSAPLLAREAPRLRLIALIHHPLADETGLDAEAREALLRAERDAVAHVGRIVVTSRWTAARLGELGIGAGNAASIAVVEPGTDRARAADGSDAVPEPERDDGGELRLLSVATLTPRKGHALLLEALAPLRDLPWRLDCAGSDRRDPQTATALRDSIGRLGLGRRVFLHGEVGDAALERLYGVAHVFVLPSYLEGYGMALAAALARGLPVVATSAGAIPDVVPADAGRLVPAGDSAALRAALESLMRDAALRRRLAAGARAAGRALPTWAEAGERFAAAVPPS
ncbi:MAG: glycosyltransferase family 4 protein [Gammaproteobacteria bacterium]|nr:glycosyltransferase family 4 protein [Gammaproteobacteria bacterium]